jgi:hypothetical protein
VSIENIEIGIEVHLSLVKFNEFECVSTELST